MKIIRIHNVYQFVVIVAYKILLTFLDSVYTYGKWVKAWRG